MCVMHHIEHVGVCIYTHIYTHMRTLHIILCACDTVIITYLDHNYVTLSAKTDHLGLITIIQYGTNKLVSVPAHLSSRRSLTVSHHEEWSGEHPISKSSRAQECMGNCKLVHTCIITLSVIID